MSDVVIRFSDGSSVHPSIVWVSAPINAGFFAYDVHADQQSSTDHATEIDAYDQNGKLVSRHTITGVRGASETRSSLARAVAKTAP